MPDNDTARSSAQVTPYLDRDAESERRQVAVLFADLAGFTAFCERSGEEAAYTLMQRISALMTNVVHEHGGTVKSFTGDGIMALFGVPVSLEDAPLRACRAALLIHQRIATATPEIEAEYGVRPQMRIGINTGPAIVGKVQSGDSTGITALGDTVNLASRLQSLAEPGGVLLSETAHQLVNGLAEARPAGEHQIKGKAERQKVYRLDCIREGASRFDAALSRGLSTYIGRSRELELLQRSFNGAAGTARVIDIVGEPGVGKSRLLYEFRSRQDEKSVFILQGSCWQGHQQTPFSLFIDMVRGSFRISAGEQKADKIRKLERGLTALGLGGEQNVGLLLNLLGLNDPADELNGLDNVLIGLRTRDLMFRLIQEYCRISPVVVLLEDLQWLDIASEELLARLVAAADILPLLIVHTRRTEYQPPWIGQQTMTLPLEPLSEKETFQIVQMRLGSPELRGRVARLVVGRAEGNPLFAEEIANFLVERGAVRHTTTGSDDDADIVAGAIPSTVQSLLTARVDRLPPRNRALLQAAAVMGRRFAPDLLAAVTGSDGDIDARLSAMEALDFVHFDPASHEVVFKHALMQDVLYASLLSGPCRALHLKIAGEIERRSADRLLEVAELLAHHYSRTSRTDKTVEYLAMAGAKSLRIYSLDQAEAYLRRALALARVKDREKMDEQVATIFLNLARVLFLKVNPREQVALLEPELDRIEALGDREQVPILLFAYGAALGAICRFREGRLVQDKALEVARRLGDDRAEAYARVGVISLSIIINPMVLSQFEQFAERAFAVAKRANDVHVIGATMNLIAWNYLNRGLVVEAREWADRLAGFGHERRDPRCVSMALWLVAWCDILAEDYVSARDHAEESARAGLTPFDRMLGNEAAGVARILLGQIAEGTEVVEAHRKEAMTNGWYYAALVMEGALALGMVLSGQIKKGVRRLEAVIKRCETEYGYQLYADTIRVFLAEIYIALIQGGKKPPLRMVLKNLLFLVQAKVVAARRAEALLKIALRNEQFSETGVYRARIELDLGLLHQATKRRNLAREHLERARTAASAQQATALLAKIEAATTSLAS